MLGVVRRDGQAWGVAGMRGRQQVACSREGQYNNAGWTGLGAGSMGQGAVACSREGQCGKARWTGPGERGSARVVSGGTRWRRNGLCG